VLVKPDDASKARQELTNGASFASVAKKYTASPGSQNGTELKEEVISQLNPTLGKALEKAQVGVLVGPIQAKAGDYFFKITKTKRLPATTFAEIKKSVIATVQHEHETNAVKNFDKQQGLKYRKLTLCARAWEYKPACGRVG
jgi:parvulin-like peptidyl-prolyl isomerase